MGKLLITGFIGLSVFLSNPANGQKIILDFDPMPRDTILVDEVDAPEYSADRIRKLVFREVNRFRKRYDRKTLKHDPALDSIAYAHSKDMSERSFFAHTNLDGETPSMRGHRSGYVCRLVLDNVVNTGLAENLYYSYAYRSVSRAYLRDEVRLSFDWKKESDLAREVVQGWYDSPPHRENLLDPMARAQGIGVFISDDLRVYVTQNLC